MPTTRRRRRVVQGNYANVLLGYYRDRDAVTGAVYPTPFGHAYAYKSGYNPYISGEFTMDELHVKDHGKYLTGGPFKRVKVTACTPLVEVFGKGEYVRPDGRMIYYGGFTAPADSAYGTDLVIAPDSATIGESSWLFPPMTGLPERAWNAAKPRIEKAEGYVFLREASDIPHMLKTSSAFFHDQWKKTRAIYGGTGDLVNTLPSHLSNGLTVQIERDHKMTPTKAADHFINHQFGWAPFVSDINSFYDAFSRMDEHITRLSRNNGQFTRRSVPVFKGTTVTKIGSGTGTKVFPNSSFDYDTRWNTGVSWFIGSGATWELYDILTDNCVATGKFRYYRPEFDYANPEYSSVMNTLRRRAAILGLRVNPSNIYKATPWTWAIDWVSNVGKHIDFLNDTLVDSVACEYCYVTRHTIRVRRFIQKLPFASGTLTLQFDRIVDTKQREGARSPYGFGLTLDNLTPRQIAITAALGISRSRGRWGG